MIRIGITAIFLLSTPAWANDPAPAAQDSPDLSGLLTDKKPCDADKKKAEADAAAKKAEAALQEMAGGDKKPQQPAAKSLGAVPALGNCK